MRRYQTAWRIKSAPESEKFNNSQMPAADGESLANSSLYLISGVKEKE